MSEKRFLLPFVLSKTCRMSLTITSVIRPRGATRATEHKARLSFYAFSLILRIVMKYVFWQICC